MERRVSEWMDGCSLSAAAEMPLLLSAHLKSATFRTIVASCCASASVMLDEREEKTSFPEEEASWRDRGSHSSAP